MVRGWVIALLFLFIAVNASAAGEAEPAHKFQCSPKVDPWVCGRQIAAVRGIVERQNLPMPLGWTWVVVADSEWPALQQRYRLKHDYAFTHMGERRTVLNSLLFQQFDRPVWEWAIAHESAHVVCDLVDDEAAERVAHEVMSTGLRSSVDQGCAKFTTEARRHREK